MIAAARQAATRHPDRTAAAALAVLVLVLFAPAVFGQRVFFQRDIHAYWYPHIDNAVEAVAEGSWPGWTPYVAFGRPLAADPNFQLLYPPTWLNLLMLPGAYYSLFVVTHCWAAGFGLYKLGRSLGLTPSAALLAGALWATSGPLLSAANLFHHFASAAWMAWVLLMLVRALEAPTLARGVALGATAGGQALAGSADLCLLTGVAAALYAAVFVWDGDGTRGRRLADCARMAAVSVVFAVMVAGVQWLPAAALLRGSLRAVQDPRVSTAWSMHPASLADVFVPGLVADLPVSAGWRAALFDGRGPLLVSVYLGIAAAVLVALAVLGPAHPVRRWAMLGLALFILAGLGRHSLVYRLLAAGPPFSLLRYPVKCLLPAALFWALLAGRGLQVWRLPWMDALRRRANRVAASAALLAVALLAGALWLYRAGAPASWTGASADAAIREAAGKLALSGVTLLAVTALVRVRAGRAAALSWPVAAVAVLAAADVAWAGRHVNPLAPAVFYRYRPPAAARVLADGPDVRLYVRQETAERMNQMLARGPGGWDSEAGWALGAQDLLVPPLGARWRIAGSYDGDFTGLASFAHSLFSYFLPTLEEREVALKYLRAAAVTHVASLRERPFPGLEPLGVFPSVFAAPVRLFRVPEPLPRVYVVGGARAAADANVMTAIADPTFDPRREILLPPPATATAAPADFAGTSRVARRRMDALEVEAEATAAGWLVVLEAWDRGWTARVDGRPAPVLRANGLFRAVPLPPGRHQVELRYVPPGLAPGLALTAAALLTGSAVGLRRRRELGAALKGTGAHDSIGAALLTRHR